MVCISVWYLYGMVTVVAYGGYCSQCSDRISIENQPSIVVFMAYDIHIVIAISDAFGLVATEVGVANGTVEWKNGH